MRFDKRIGNLSTWSKDVYLTSEGRKQFEANIKEEQKLPHNSLR